MALDPAFNPDYGAAMKIVRDKAVGSFTEAINDRHSTRNNWHRAAGVAEILGGASILGSAGIAASQVPGIIRMNANPALLATSAGLGVAGGLSLLAYKGLHGHAEKIRDQQYPDLKKEALFVPGATNLLARTKGIGQFVNKPLSSPAVQETMMYGRNGIKGSEHYYGTAMESSRGERMRWVAEHQSAKPLMQAKSGLNQIAIKAKQLLAAPQNKPMVPQRPAQQWIPAVGPRYQVATA